MMARSLVRSVPSLRASFRAFRATPIPRAEESASKGDSESLTLSFAIPSSPIYQDKNVNMVILPGEDGFFGVMPNHVPTIAQLKPGVVQVQEQSNGPLTKYFVSGGFASIGENSKLSISALEATLVEDLDVEAVKAGLAQYQAAYAAATEDMAKAEAEIGVEVYQAMSYAISEQ